MQLSQAMYVTLGMPHIGNPSVSQIEIWAGGHITYLRITSSSHHSIIVTSLHHYHTKPKDSVININIWQATWGPCEWRDMFGSKRSQEAKKSKEQGVMIKKNSLEKKTAQIVFEQWYPLRPECPTRPPRLYLGPTIPSRPAKGLVESNAYAKPHCYMTWLFITSSSNRIPVHMNKYLRFSLSGC